MVPSGLSQQRTQRCLLCFEGIQRWNGRVFPCCFRRVRTIFQPDTCALFPVHVCLPLPLPLPSPSTGLFIFPSPLDCAECFIVGVFCAGRCSLTLLCDAPGWLCGSDRGSTTLLGSAVVGHGSPGCNAHGLLPAPGVQPESRLCPCRVAVAAQPSSSSGAPCYGMENVTA